MNVDAIATAFYTALAIYMTLAAIALPLIGYFIYRIARWIMKGIEE